MMDPKGQAQFQQMQRAFTAQQIPRTVTAAATVALADYLVACDATSAGFTLTLPAVKDARGMSFLVVKIDSSVNAVTIDGSGSETINGATTLAISKQWNGVTIYCDGVSWYTVIPSALLGASLTLSGLMTGGVVLTTGTYVNGDTTPTVLGVSVLDVRNTAPTTITNFDDGVTGQVIVLHFHDANTTITRANALLAGSVNFVSVSAATLTLMKILGNWWELTRSTVG